MLWQHAHSVAPHAPCFYQGSGGVQDTLCSSPEAVGPNLHTCAAICLGFRSHGPCVCAFWMSVAQVLRCQVAAKIASLLKVWEVCVCVCVFDQSRSDSEAEAAAWPSNSDFQGVLFCAHRQRGLSCGRAVTAVHWLCTKQFRCAGL